MVGKILKLFENKFGYIVDTTDRQYFFFYKSLKNIKFEDLTIGQEVTFEEVDTSQGWRAEDIYI